MTERVLITGGLGYIGGRVARHLAARTPDYLLLGSRRAHGEKPRWLERGEVTPLDVMDEGSLRRACRGLSAVVHLAALNEVDSAADPESALTINGLGSLKLLMAAIGAGVQRFVYVSTAHVYGAPLAGVVDERTLPRPHHPYAITHRVAEDFVLAAHDRAEITGVVLRLSNGFGAPERATVERWTLLVNDLCRQAVTARRMVLRSSGLQRRDFIPMSDVARAVAHFLTLTRDRVGDGLFNLGGEAPLAVLDMAEQIAERCEAVLGFRPDIDRPPPAPGDTAPPLDYRIDKLKATGFRLEGGMTEEIDATLLLCQRAFAAP